MYRKIHNTAQLYSADVQSIGLFLNNLEKNYSKLFVAGKLLAAEAKNLQILNSYLLSMLSQRHNLEVTKNSEIEDLKAQLESEVRIKTFFSNKSHYSEQRALILQNQKLNQELKLRELTAKYNESEKLSSAAKEQLEELQRKNNLLVRDNKSLKQNYDSTSSKYKAVMQELQLLQQTLVQLKIQ